MTLVAVLLMTSLMGFLPFKGTMLILRGVASADAPRGQLDDGAALAYARRHGYSGHVLDVSGEIGSTQVAIAIAQIRANPSITAIYGFSGGGYNASLIWNHLTPEERQRVRMIVVVGSPGVTPSSFPGHHAQVRVQPDPPEGHLAGPQVLLDSGF
jgi:hypothetical protein